MPNINFPSGPTAGTTYIFNSGQWTYNGVAWVLNGTPGPSGATGPAGVTGSLGGTGSTNRVAVFTGTTTLGNSSITDDGTLVTIGSYLRVTNFLSYDKSVGFSGEIVYFGSGTTTSGALYYFDGSGWTQTNASAEERSKFLLAIALGSSPSSNGMLVRGYGVMSSVSGFTNGNILYISDSADGDITNVVPTTSGSVVRIVGYVVDSGTGQLYFCPDTTWIKLV